MIFQLYIADTEVKARLEKLGYTTEMVEKPEWKSTYHNRDELTTRMVLHVVDNNGKKVPALDFLESLMDEAIMSLLARYKQPEFAV